MTHLIEAITMRLLPTEVVVKEHLLPPIDLHLIRQALRQQLQCLSMDAAPTPGMRADKLPIDAVRERRAVLRLLEQFEGVVDADHKPIPATPKFEINFAPIGGDDVRRTLYALSWYRDYWIRPDDPRHTQLKALINALIEFIEAP